MQPSGSASAGCRAAPGAPARQSAGCWAARVVPAQGPAWAPQAAQSRCAAELGWVRAARVAGVGLKPGGECLAGPGSPNGWGWGARHSAPELDPEPEPDAAPPASTAFPKPAPPKMAQ